MLETAIEVDPALSDLTGGEELSQPLELWAEGPTTVKL